MKTSIELFAWPWDIADCGPEKFVDECGAMGVTRVHATTLYHSGKFLLPRNRTAKVYFPESGRLYVPIHQDAFPGKIRPRASGLVSSGWFERFTRAASDARIGLAAWTVFHHSSTLVGEHAEYAVRNLFGDVYPFAFCPSHAEVRSYSVSLASALRSLGAFDTLDLETIGYLGYWHGHHHEVTAVPVGVFERFLLSLCFCPACCEAAAEEGIEIGELRENLQRILLPRLSERDSTSAHPENLEQLLTLVALSESLQQLIRLRMKIVTELVRRIRGVVDGAALGVFTSSFVGSPSNIWMEGVSLPDLRSTTDVFHLLAYSSDTQTVNVDLDYCLDQVPDADRLNLTLNLGLPITPTLDHAMAKVEYAWRRGVRRFAFFNYGLLGKERLRWVKEIRTCLERKETRED